MQRHWLVALHLASVVSASSWPHSTPAPRRALQDGLQGATYIEFLNAHENGWDERVRVRPPSQVCPCSWSKLHGSLAIAVPADACAANVSANYRGAFVLVERGGCDFATKAEHMQRAGATGIIVCDNATGDPVDMNLGQDASRLTLGIVSVNAEASNMLHSYVARPLRGETYQMYTEGCPYNIGTLESQVLVWGIGVVSCVVAAYMSAAHERRIATGATLPYDYQAMETRDRRDAPDDDDGDLTIMQAVVFTVLASAVLVVLYYFIEKLIVVVIVFYCVGATGALHHLLCIFGAKLVPSLHRQVYNLPYFGHATTVMILCFLPAVCTSSAWFYYRHERWAWALQNILSFSLCIQILSLIRVGSVRIAACLLSMMFVYDIFWVFLSGLIFKQSVMVTVATGGGGESLPMLFMIPHACGYSLLGLGDIVIPGVLLSLNIRLDYLKNVHPFSTASYFGYSCIGYAVGLATADAAVMWSGMGQPALLYLVPCTLGVTTCLAVSRGELGWVWDKPFVETYRLAPGDRDGNRTTRGVVGQEARMRLL